jgi:hypothetical protein
MISGPAGSHSLADSNAGQHVERPFVPPAGREHFVLEQKDAWRVFLVTLTGKIREVNCDREPSPSRVVATGAARAMAVGASRLKPPSRWPA